MASMIWAAQLVAGLSLCLPSQQSDLVESTFHRVHLKNGNFIDGQLLKDLPRQVLLRISTGEMEIRRDQIDRVEFVKMRSVNERPVVKVAPKDTVVPGAKTTDPARLPEVPSTAAPEIQKKVNEVLMKYKSLTGTEKGALPTEEIAALGEEAAVYLAGILPKLDTALQQPAAIALATLKSPKACLVLEEQTRHANPNVRLNAVTALGLMGVDEKNRYLRPLLRDPEPAVRGLVLNMVNSLDDRDWFDPVSDLCGDASMEVRNSALAMASRLAAKHDLKDALIRVVVSNLSSNVAGVRADSAATLGGLGKAEHWTSLAPLLRDNENNVRAAAALGLGNLGALAAGPDIVGQLPGERDHWTRIYLAGACQRMKLSSAIEPLINWLTDANQEIRSAAGVALQTITSERFGVDREKWQAWFERSKPK